MIMSSELPSYSTSLFTSLALLISVVLLLSFKRHATNYTPKSDKARAPPGPKGIPFFGNEFQMPRDKHWLKFHEWSQHYGDVVQITTMGQPIVILSSAQAALDLLEIRGNIYSDRPKDVMAGELVGWDRGLGYAPYGERFREFRKMFHQTMGPRVVQDLSTLQEKETAQLLLRLLDKPEAFMEHARQSVGAVVLMLAYGYSAKLENDPMVKIAEEAMLGFSKASEPGAYLVNRFPWLKYVPNWFLGAGFKLEANRMKEDRECLYDIPFDYVKDQMASGSFIPSFTSKYLLEIQEVSDEQKEEFVKAAAASLYSGGADTTPSSITAFILAMILYPEIQARGHAEVDTLLGKRRLPSISDRDSLPYVNAIVKEVLRWNPAVPLGLPHLLTQDDYYREFRLAKGTIVEANIWSILHDERVYPDPDVFRPERYLDGNLAERTQDPSMLAFGFGRRICPGMYLADNSIFLAVASILSVFAISKAKDADGKLIAPIVDFRGFISHPKPFRCDIRPRSEEAVELIRRATS